MQVWGEDSIKDANRFFIHEKIPASKLYDPNSFEKIKMQSIPMLNSDKIEQISRALWNSSICLKVDRSTLSLIQKEHVEKILNIIREGDPGIKFLSLAFKFLSEFIRSDPSKIPFFQGTNILQIALSKIPLDSSCDFIVELLSFSENIETNSKLSVFPFFIENNLRSKLLHLFAQFANLEHQQAQFLRILSFLWKHEDFEKEEFTVFIETSNLFLNRSFRREFNDNDFIIFMNFLSKIKSNFFYANFVEVDKLSKWIELIFRKINTSRNNELCISCFNFLIDLIDSSDENAEYLINQKISDKINEFLSIKNLEPNVRIKGSMVIEELAEKKEDYCLTFILSDYVETLKAFLKKGSFTEQCIALRFVSVLMKYKNEYILNLLVEFDPVDKIIEILNADQYSIILKILFGIKNEWDAFLINKIANDFLSSLIDLMQNQEFISTLENLQMCDNNEVSEMANQLLEYIKQNS